MVGILMDIDTGDPMINFDTGNMIIVDNQHAFKQIISGVLNCLPGSELLNIYYGFDLVMAMRLIHLENSEMFIESLLAEALDPRKEKLISNVNFIKAVKDFTTPRKMDVTIDLNSITGENISLTEAIGENEI